MLSREQVEYLQNSLPGKFDLDPSEISILHPHSFVEHIDILYGKTNSADEYVFATMGVSEKQNAEIYIKSTANIDEKNVKYIVDCLNTIGITCLRGIYPYNYIFIEGNSESKSGYKGAVLVPREQFDNIDLYQAIPFYENELKYIENYDLKNRRDPSVIKNLLLQIKNEYIDINRDELDIEPIESVLKKPEDVYRSVFFGRYFQNDENTPTSIEWYVLNKDKNRVLLLSKNILQYKPLKSPDDRSFAGLHGKEIDRWLDEFFEAAFNNKEKECIQTTNINNPQARDQNIRKVFRLPSQKVSSCFLKKGVSVIAPVTSFAYKTAEETKCTGWAAYASFKPYFSDVVLLTDYNEAIRLMWYSEYEKNVYGDAGIGIRPAMYVDPIILESNWEDKLSVNL